MFEDNCDYKARLEDLSKDGKSLYGKKMLTSHRNYKLWDEDTDVFYVQNIERFYEYFVQNMTVLASVFPTRWVSPTELLTASKGLIWDWTSEEERLRNAEDIYTNGLYFPITTLEKGLLHNQVHIKNMDEYVELSNKMLYNSYNGNHRIDIIQNLYEIGMWPKNKKVLIFIVPPYCQKSCTGFKYTPIDDSVESTLTSYKLNKPIRLIHFDRVEHEMKVFNWRFREPLYIDGVSSVMVDNYNVAFRIMTEAQNILEPVLSRYFEIFGKLPNRVDSQSRIFNVEGLCKEFKNTSVSDSTFQRDNYISYTKASENYQKCEHVEDNMCEVKNMYRNCNRSMCCGICPKVDSCDNKCTILQYIVKDKT